MLRSLHGSCHLRGRLPLKCFPAGFGTSGRRPAWPTSPVASGTCPPPENIPGAPSAPMPPATLPPHRRQVDAIVADSGHLTLFIAVASSTIPSTCRRRGGSAAGDADGGPLMKDLLAAGKCHLPQATRAEQVAIRMSATPPEDLSAGGRQQRQDPRSDRNAAQLREISHSETRDLSLSGCRRSCQRFRRPRNVGPAPRSSHPIQRRTPTV